MPCEAGEFRTAYATQRSTVSGQRAEALRGRPAGKAVGSSREATCARRAQAPHTETRMAPTDTRRREAFTAQTPSYMRMRARADTQGHERSSAGTHLVGSFRTVVVRGLGVRHHAHDRRDVLAERRPAPNGACRREHADRSTPTGARRPEHADRSTPTGARRWRTGGRAPSGSARCTGTASCSARGRPSAGTSRNKRLA